MPSGWTRFILEQFEFPFEVVYPQALDSGNLASRFDVIIFPSGVGPAPAAAGRGGRGGGGGAAAAAAAAGANIPAEYQDQLGAYTAAQTGPHLKKFLEDGGTILAVGRSATNLARAVELPVDNHCRASAGRHRRGRCPRRSTTCRVRCCAWRSTPPRRSRTA